MTPDELLAECKRRGIAAKVGKPRKTKRHKEACLMLSDSIEHIIGEHAISEQECIYAQIGMKLPNWSNSRVHWGVKSSSTAHQKLRCYKLFAKCHLGWAAAHDAAIAGKPIRITLTRCGPGRLDSDGPQSALKYVRDAISHYLGVDDGAANLDWQYRSIVQPESGAMIEVSF